MSFIPNNPPVIVHEYSCVDTASAEPGGRQGVKIWEGRCAGFMVHSWPHAEQVLEIIDRDTNNTMAIIPVPGKPILFGTIKSVALLVSYKVSLMVEWRTVLEAFIDPIYAMLYGGIHGHAQWCPGSRLVELQANGLYVEQFYAWADGIIRVVVNAGSWRVSLSTMCGIDTYSIVPAYDMVVSEEDIPLARVTAGRWYDIGIRNKAVGVANLSFDYAIVVNPIAQA